MFIFCLFRVSSPIILFMLKIKDCLVINYSSTLFFVRIGATSYLHKIFINEKNNYSYRKIMRFRNFDIVVNSYNEITLKIHSKNCMVRIYTQEAFIARTRYIMIVSWLDSSKCERINFILFKVKNIFIGTVQKVIFCPNNYNLSEKWLN